MRTRSKLAGVAVAATGVVAAIVLVVGGGTHPPRVESKPVTVVSPPPALKVTCAEGETDVTCRARLLETVDDLNRLAGGFGG